MVHAWLENVSTEMDTKSDSLHLQSIVQPEPTEELFLFSPESQTSAIFDPSELLIEELYMHNIMSRQLKSQETTHGIFDTDEFIFDVQQQLVDVTETFVAFRSNDVLLSTTLFDGTQVNEEVGPFHFDPSDALFKGDADIAYLNVVAADQEVVSD